MTDTPTEELTMQKESDTPLFNVNVKNQQLARMRKLPLEEQTDLIVVELVDPEGHKLITKKYLEYVVSDLSTFLTINDTASIVDTGHYLSGYDVYNRNNEIDPAYYPLSTS
jgi:hypothetical protein